MDNQEYEQKRFKEWLRYKRDNFVFPDAKIVFDYAFDCAYTLSKQEKDLEKISTAKKSSDKLKEGDIAICTYDTLTEVYITKVEETSYGIVYTTAYCIKGRIYFKRFHENYIIKK